jgi:UDP-GlcNAc:undecaprenyl-phosphate/decaprenyl-phosphate GlcNAc-1-phosphate transferase
VIIKRLLSGKNPLSTPGKDHLHHRLLARGFSQRHSAVILWGVNLAGGLVAMHMQGVRHMAIVATAIGITSLLMLTIWQRLRAPVEAPDRLVTSDSATTEQESEHRE